MSYLPWRERRVVPVYDTEHIGRVKIDREKCNGCGYCVLICVGVSIHIRGEGRDRKACFEPDTFSSCMSCNDCAAICKQDAIFVTEPYDFGGFYKTLHRGPFEPPRRF